MPRTWNNLAEAAWIERATQQNPWWLKVRVVSQVRQNHSVFLVVQPTAPGHYATVTDDWTDCRCSFIDPAATWAASDDWLEGRVHVVDRLHSGAPRIVVRLSDAAHASRLPVDSVCSFTVREADFYAGITTWAGAVPAAGATPLAGAPAQPRTGSARPAPAAPDAWLRTLARSAVGTPRLAAPPGVPLDASKAGLLTAAPSRVQAIWGPPGTGKTYTLGHLVASHVLAGRRALVMSISNRAVDQAILGADDAWREQQGGRPPPGNEILVRAREPVHPSLSLPDRAHLIAGWKTAVAPWQERRTAILDQLTAQGLSNEQRIALLEALNDNRERLNAALRALIQRSCAVFVTLTHQRMSDLIPLADFDTILVDEAGFAPAAVATMIADSAASTSQVYFAGDFQQLRPIVNYRPVSLNTRHATVAQRRPYPPLVFHDGDERVPFPWVDSLQRRQEKNAFVRAWFASTVYEMLGLEDAAVGSDPAAAARRASAQAEGWFHVLNVQRRMPAELCTFLSRWVYGGAGVVTSPPGHHRPQGPLSKVFGVPGPLLWSSPVGANGTALSGAPNRLESEGTAKLVATLAAHALREPEVDIFILTRFNAQVRAIRTALVSLIPHQAQRRRVEVSTIHKAQGGERELVIIDPICTIPWWVYGKPFGCDDWNDEVRAMNVALSRARREVFIFLHDNYAREHPLLGPYMTVARQVTAANLLG